MSCVCKYCGYQTSVSEDFHTWSNIPNFHPEVYPVTKSGKPDGELLGFICAKCLGNAQSMRSHIKGMVANIKVTQHAAERFMQRTNACEGDVTAARVAITKAFSKAKEIRFTDKYMFKRLLNNRVDVARYFLTSDLVFVVTEDPRTIVTVEKLQGKKQGRDYFLI